MTERVVVDASVAFKWIFPEEHSGEARSLLNQWINNHTTILVPAWFMFEIVNILYKHIRRNALTLQAAFLLIEEMQNIGIQIPEYDQGLHNRALELTIEFRLNAAYDAHYMALAERMNCDLWTADERLWNSVRTALGWVRWIGEPPPTPA